MMNSVILRTIYQRRGFILGWTLGLAALAALMAVFYPSMRPEAGMQTLIESMPAAFQGLVGDMEALNRFDTYLATQLFDIRGSILIGIMAVIIGVGLSTREEESGELRTYLAQPVSRGRYHLEQWLSLVVIIAITTGVGLTAGLYATMPFVEGADLEIAGLMRILAMTALIMVALASITYAAGRMSGKRSVATLVGTVVLTASFIISSFSVGVDWLRDLEPLSLFHYFQAADIIVSGPSFSDVAVLVSLLVVSLMASWLIFRRRDVA